jgi:opacity protein-like surface antigen
MGLRQPGSPISFRAEGVYTAYNQKFSDNTKTSAGGITGNALYTISVSPGTPVTPYIIGGIGYYNTRVDVRSSEVASEWDIGWNLGGGLRFPLSGFSAYIEARYNKVSNADVAFTPIVFGLAF